MAGALRETRTFLESASGRKAAKAETAAAAPEPAAAAPSEPGTAAATARTDGDGDAEGEDGLAKVKAAGPLAVAGNEVAVARTKMLETLAAGKEKALTFDVFSVRLKRYLESVTTAVLDGVELMAPRRDQLALRFAV